MDYGHKIVMFPKLFTCIWYWN